MKLTDYAPRAAFLDTKLTGFDLIGVEVGCDVGAHAEALLLFTNTRYLYLIDTFDNPWCEGYCFGRLAGFNHKVKIIKNTSESQAAHYKAGIFDYVYIDIEHDEASVTGSLNDWWPTLKSGGIMGYRNYSSCKGAIDKFVHGKRYEISEYHNEIVIWKM